MATPNIATMIAGDYANIDSDIKVSVTVKKYLKGKKNLAKMNHQNTL
jgi:hypothetical protein